MLALTRRVGEEIILGDPQTPLGVIRVVDIHGDKVRLSFDFPREMPINRRELAEQKLRELGLLPPASKKPTNPNTSAKSAPTPATE